MKIIEGVIRAENPTELLSPALAMIWTRALAQQWTSYQPLRTIFCPHLIGAMLVEANREHPEKAALSLRAIQSRVSLLGTKQVNAMNSHLYMWSDPTRSYDLPFLYEITGERLQPTAAFIEIADGYVDRWLMPHRSVTGIKSRIDTREMISLHMVEMLAGLILRGIHTLRQGALLTSTMYRHMIGQDWVLLNELAAELDLATSRVSESLAGAMETGFVRHRRNPLNTRMTEIRFEWPTDAGEEVIETVARRNQSLGVLHASRPDQAFDLLRHQPISPTRLKLAELTRRDEPLKILQRR